MKERRDKFGHLSLAGWVILIIVGWAALLICATFWPGWYTASPPFPYWQ